MPMLTLKSSHHLKTMRHLKSFRSCRTATGRCMWRAEVSRIYQEEVALINRELRRRWLAEAWKCHQRGWRPLSLPG
jgi:hypothetical protein